MANSVKRAAAALALAAGAGALTGCGTVQGIGADINSILPNSSSTAAVQSRVGGVVATEATATPPGAYVDPRGYQRYSDTGAVVSAPQGACTALRQAAIQANIPDRTAQQTGNQMGAYAQRGVQGAGQAAANGIMYGNANAGKQAGAIVGSSVAGMAGAYVGGLFRGGARDNAQDAAKARYQAAYGACSQEFAAQVDARCSGPVGGNRNAAAYTQCFDRNIANSPAPAKVPSR